MSALLSHLPANHPVRVACGVALLLTSGACTSSLEDELDALDEAPLMTDAGADDTQTSAGGQGGMSTAEPADDEPSGQGGSSNAGEGGGGGEPAGGGGSGGKDSSGGMGGGAPSGGMGGEAQCVPDCSGRQCGDDGCGTSCGECAAGSECQVDQCVATSLVFEVEEATFAGAMRAANTIAGFSGSGYGDCAGQACGFSISANVTGGTYYMDVTYHVSGVPQSFKVTVNSSNWLIHKFRTNGTWRTDSIHGLVLTPGVNTLGFESLGGTGPYVDRVTLWKDDGTRYRIVVEAESATPLGCGETKMQDGGTVISLCAPDSVSSYTVNVPKAGPAIFTFRSATAHPSARMQLLDADGVELADSDTLSGALDNFGTYSVKTNQLAAGTQVLKLRNVVGEIDTNWWSISQ